MASFFDKLSQFSQSTVQRTKDLSEISKLNSQIADAQKRQNNLFFQIGKLYYTANKEAPGKEYAELVKEITDIDELISGNHSRINFLNGIVTCPNCGRENTIDATFCVGCGKEMPKIETEPKERHCPACNAVISEGMRFCTSCGAPVTPQNEAITPEAGEMNMQPLQDEVPKPDTTAPQGEAPVASAPAPEAEAADTGAGSDVKAGSLGVCPHCGAELFMEGALFCTSCGKKL